MAPNQFVASTAPNQFVLPLPTPNYCEYSFQPITSYCLNYRHLLVLLQTLITSKPPFVASTAPNQFVLPLPTPNINISVLCGYFKTAVCCLNGSKSVCSTPSDTKYQYQRALGSYRLSSIAASVATPSLRVAGAPVSTHLT